jgi:outer membrane protein TolC
MSAYRGPARKIWAVVILGLLFLPEQMSAETFSWAPPGLTSLIEEGLRQNGEILSMEAEVASLESKIPFAGSLDDPRLGLGILNLPADSFRFDREPMTQKQISIAQKIPWFGKLDLRQQQAALNAARLKALLDAKKLELTLDIAANYFDLGFIASSLRVNDQLTAEIDQLLRFAETRYATGGGLQQDVLQAQVELSKLLDEKIVLENRQRVLEDRINELLNRDRFQPVEAQIDPKPLSLALNVEQLQSRAVSENPGLAARMLEIHIADIEVELSRKDFWPDFDFKFAYGQRDEDRTGRSLPDFVSGSVVMNIPLWQETRQRPKLDAALQARSAASHSHRSLLAALPHRVNSLVVEIRNTQQNYELFKNALVLQAEQWARSSLSAYEVGSVEFNTMIEARVQKLRFDLQADHYLYNIYKNCAELETVLGGALQPGHTQSVGQQRDGRQ